MCLFAGRHDEQPSDGPRSPKTPAPASSEMPSLFGDQKTLPSVFYGLGYVDFVKVLEVDSHGRFSREIGRLEALVVTFPARSR
jgi:hypothetical protein